MSTKSMFEIKVKIGNGIATYRFDSLERALEMVGTLIQKNEEFTTNFEYENKESV